MDRDLLVGLGFLAAMLALFGGLIYRLVMLLKERYVPLETTGTTNAMNATAPTTARPRHTWKDTIQILLALVVFGILLAAGVRDRGMIQILLLSIAAWYLWGSRKIYR
jgi:hypothetical protein